MNHSESIASRIKQEFNKKYPCLPPVGSVIGWQKNLFPAPTLPTNWVECNGQVVNDVDSPLHGVTLPNLNSAKRILKGGVIAGLLETVGLKTANSPNVTINTSSVTWIIRIK